MLMPKVGCSVCGRVKNPMQHMRADHPPTAAKAWLKKTCKTEGKPCAFGYRAGIDVEGLRRSLQKRFLLWFVQCRKFLLQGRR